MFITWKYGVLQVIDIYHAYSFGCCSSKKEFFHSHVGMSSCGREGGGREMRDKELQWQTSHTYVVYRSTPKNCSLYLVKVQHSFRFFSGTLVFIFVVIARWYMTPLLMKTKLYLHRGTIPMWQHRFAVWGGILGASASCLAKVAVSGDSPLQRLQNEFCPRYIQRDLDDIIGTYIYKVAGNLMIRRRINFMPFILNIRNILQNIASRFFIFEVNWCQTLLLGPRIVLLICMLIMNAYMIAAFMKGMQVSGSVVGTAITTACNFTMSAFWGYFLWKERFQPSWWFGFTCVLLGVLLLSSVQTHSDDQKKTTRTSSNGTVRSYDQGMVSTYTMPRKSNVVISDPPGSTSTIDPPGSTIDTSSYRGGRPSAIETSALGINPSNGKKSIFGDNGWLGLPTQCSPTPEPQTPNRKSLIRPNNSRIQKQRGRISALVDRSGLDLGCPLCEAPLFAEDGTAELAVADLSPSCYHAMHARCIKYRQKQDKNLACPICDRAVPMFVNATETAHFAGFWIPRVETCLRKLGPASGGQPLPASIVREWLAKDKTLTDAQKVYIDDDPSGLGKGLLSAFEWGGAVDHNDVQKGHRGWHGCLKTKGIWTYSPKFDDLWLWEWGKVHPRQRCDQCQLLRALPISCPDCQGSSEAAFYCSDLCQKRDRQRHKMTCTLWQDRVSTGSRKR